MPAIEEELALDVTPALAGIESIDSALQQVVTAFAVGLADALGILRDVTIEDVDASAVTDGLTDAVEAGTTAVTIDDVDATAVTDSIAAAADDAASDLTASLDDAVDAFDPAAIDVPITADSSDVIAELDAATAAVEPIDVPITADTAELEDSLISASGAAISTDSAFTGLALAGDAAGGSVEGLTTALVDNIPALAGAGAAIAGFVGFIQSAVGGAAEAERATARLGQVFGDFAGDVQQINVGGLRSDLQDLAITVGDNDEAILNAISRFGELGIATGVSQQQVADLSSDFVGLAAALAVSNPSLGDTATVLQGLQGGFQRGGRFLAQYGIALTKAQIDAEALRQTGKATAAELTVFDRTTAGLTLSLDQLGDTLGDKVAENAELAEVKFASLATAFGEAIEAIGSPLLAPSVDLIESLVPIGVSIAEVFGQAAETIVPLVATLVDALGPAIVDVTDAVGELIEALSPAVEGLGEGLGAAATVAAEVLGGLADVVGVIADVIGILPDGLLTAAAALYAFRAASLAAVDGALALGNRSVGTAGTIGILIAELAALASITKDIVWGDTLPSPDEVESVQEFSAALSDAFATVEGANSTLSDLDSLVQEFISSLNTTELENTALVSFLRFAPDALDGVGAALRGSEADLIAWIEAANSRDGEPFLSPSNIEDVTGALVSLQQQLRAQARTSAASLIANEKLNATIYDQAIAANTSADGQIDYVAALDDAVDAQRRYEAATNAAALSAAATSGAFRDLTADVLAGNVAVEDAVDVAAQLGIAEADAAAFIQAVSDAVTGLADSFSSVLPQAADAFSGFQAGIDTAVAALDSAKGSGEGVVAAFDALVAAADPQRLVEQFAQQAIAIASFQTNIETLLSQGLERTAQVLLEQGPVVGGALAQALVDGQPETRAALEGSVAIFDEATRSFTTKAETEWAPQIAGATGAAFDAAAEAAGVSLEGVDPVVETAFAENVPAAIRRAEGGIAGQAGVTAGAATGAFGGALGLDAETSSALAGVTTVFGQGGVGQAAYDAGFGVGQSFGSGIVNGIGSFVASIATAAAGAVDAAEAAARQAAESQSPSRLFARLGADLAEGLAVGIAASVGSVEAAAAATVDAAADAAGRRARARQAAPTLSTVEGTVRDALRRLEGVSGDALDRAQRRSTAALDDSLNAVLRTVSTQLAGTSAADRFRLTTGALTVGDVVQPMADAINATQDRGEARIERAFADAGGRIEVAFDRVATRIERAFDRLADAERRRAEREREQARAEVNVTVVGASPGTAAATGRVIGDTTARTLEQRGVRARVRST